MSAFCSNRCKSEVFSLKIFIIYRIKPTCAHKRKKMIITHVITNLWLFIIENLIFIFYIFSNSIGTQKLFHASYQHWSELFGLKKMIKASRDSDNWSTSGTRETSSCPTPREFPFLSEGLVKWNLGKSGPDFSELDEE